MSAVVDTGGASYVRDYLEEFSVRLVFVKQMNIVFPVFVEDNAFMAIRTFALLYPFI